MINAISKLNEKLKVIILILYTAIAGLVALLLLNMNNKVDYLSEYSSKPYNEYISLTVKLKENRESTYKTKTDYESSTYFLSAFAQKGSEYKKAKYSKIKYSLTGINESGKYSFDETASEYSMSEGNKTGISSSSTISSGSIFSKKITIKDNVKTETNNIPVILGLKVLFTIEYNEVVNNEDGTISYEYKSSSKNEIKKIESEFNYKFDLTQLKDVEDEFSSFKERELKKQIVANTNDPFNLKIETTFTDEESKEGSVKTDKLTITPSLNAPVLLGKEVEEFKIEIFGKVNNDKKDKEQNFDDYIRVYSVYGKDMSETAVKLAAVELDEEYDISELYIISSVKCINGEETEVIKVNYKVKLK